MKPRSIISIDVGYGNTKLVYKHLIDAQGHSRWSEFCFPSVAPRAMAEDMILGVNNPNRILIEVDGQNYFAGLKPTSASVPRTLSPDYIGSVTHEVLLRTAIHIAMREAGHFQSEVDLLVLGLPVSGFQSNAKRLHEIAMRPRTVPVPEGMNHQFGEARSIEVKAKDCMIFPQPYGGFRLAADTLTEDDPIFKNGMVFMVIDPGYRTFDWFVSSGLHPELNMSGSFDGGVSSILRAVSSKLGFDTGFGSLEFDMVEHGLNTGTINLGHTVIDMTPYRKVANDAAEKEVSAFVTRLSATNAKISRIFLTGGGAHFYEEALRKRLPGYEIISMANSVMSNARGYWLAGADKFMSA